jgi:P27 family predicted phage terminase small subunit
MPNPRKPTALKVVAGTDRKDRRHAHEPQPEQVLLPAPRGLSVRAKTVWRLAAPLLHGMRVLTAADGPALEGLCEAIADLRAARAALAKSISIGIGPDKEVIAAGGSLTYVTVGKSGPMIRMRPEVAAIADADRRVCMWLGRFGLTPADRGRVGAAAPEKSNAFAEFG